MTAVPRPPLAAPARREEGEKFNVWVAYLNMENVYGSEEATLSLLSRALAHTDARKMYLAAGGQGGAGCIFLLHCQGISVWPAWPVWRPRPPNPTPLPTR